MSNYLYKKLKRFFTTKRIALSSIIGISISCGLIVGCAPVDTSYIQTKIGSVHVCELEMVDTSKMLGVGEIDSRLSSDKLISLYDESRTEWKVSDINISRCSPKVSIDLEKALRVHVSEDKWSHGFQFTYDLYFNDDDQLVAIESRHRFIEI